MVDIQTAVREAQGVRKVRADEVPRTAAVLRSAFVDDPVFAWLLPDDERRGEILERGFRLFLERIWFAQGECYTTENMAGAVVWELPGQWKLSVGQQLRLLPAMVSAFRLFTPRALSVFAKMEAGHPEAEHYYLPLVGVTPEWQGRGIGAALMAPILDRCDRDQIPAYLGGHDAAQSRTVRAAPLQGHRGVPRRQRLTAAVAHVAQPGSLTTGHARHRPRFRFPCQH